MRSLLVALALVACRTDDPKTSEPTSTPPSPTVSTSDTDDTDTPATTPFDDVASDETWSLPALSSEVVVVRTTGSIPYIYASDRYDLAVATGFVLARDRFFMIDLIRRLGSGRLTELVGDAALPTDQESRALGMTTVAERFQAAVERDPELTAVLDGNVEGINAYIEAVAAGELPVPSELATLGPLLGVDDPVQLMEPFTRADMAAMGATITYNLGFETTDVGRAANHALLDDVFAGAEEEALRQAGVFPDIWDRPNPVWPICSAAWGPIPRSAAPVASGVPRASVVPQVVTQRLADRLERFERRLGHDHEHGYGSNAWAVAGSASADGRALLAGDGHLPLSVPSLFYSLGMNTKLLGGGDIHQVGTVLPGLPTLAVGTNGKVAWSQTQLFGDITDWYAEQLVLDASGAPVASIFQGSEQPLVPHEETYEIASVPLLGSIGRTETWTRYATFDGRLITEIEGRESSPDDPLADGETLVNVAGAWVVPGDLDGDGIVSAISVDHTAFDDGNILAASDGFGRADDVFAFQEETKRLVAYSQNIVAADADGHIFYTGYQAVPLRGYLPRDADGDWLPGADPTLLIDGTQYGGFTIPVDAEGKVDETSADPYQQVVPFVSYPQSIDPPEGYVQTANNDIGCISTDGSLTNDPFYVGGPWLEGYRAKRIVDELERYVEEGTADIDAMSTLHADHWSTTAEHYLPYLLQGLADARDASASGPHPDGSAEQRLAALYDADQARFDEVESRLMAWQQSGLWARSGVETFYAPVEPGDLEAAVATTLWHSWLSAFLSDVLDDEGLPNVHYPTGDTGRTRLLTFLLDGRGDDNPLGQASWNPDTGESIYFDVRGTPEIETSEEVMVSALTRALDALAAPNEEPGRGGFGTDDMSEYLWGMRHMARFETLLVELFGDDPTFSFLLDPFHITPETLPLMPGLASDDPRADLPWFPRHGDMFVVDAAHPGFGLDDHTYGSGPVFRMVIALGPDGAEGVNVLPGGQSGLNDSPYFADQAALWLGNETWPMHTRLEAVLADAVSVERYQP
jgi:penicillin amidase